MEIVWTLIIMALCLICEGFFSGSEIGVVSADQIKLRHQAAKGSRGAKLALKMLKKPEWLLSTTLVGTNISVVTNTTMATALMLQLFGEKGSWLSIFLVVPFIWVFGEIVPKSIFQQRADTLTPRAIFFLRFASYVFYPILAIFSLITLMFTKLLGRKGENPFTLREQIITMLQMPAEQGDIRPVEKDMIRRIFSFSETTAQEIMVPLIDVAAVDRDMTCGEALRIANKNAHIRLPVYNRRVDLVTGMLNALELLGVNPEEPIEPYVRPVRYVPGSKSIEELLLDLRKAGDPVAIVVDEFGGAQGLVTREDIMEEVVEEIEDEYDNAEKPQGWVRKISERDYIVSARIELNDLNEEVGIELPKGEYTTLAGFLLARACEIPPVEAVIKEGRITFTIHRATPQVIQEVRIRW